MRQVAQAHTALNGLELATAAGFLGLIIQQVEGDLPARFARHGVGVPVTKVRDEGIEVETFAGKDRNVSEI